MSALFHDIRDVAIADVDSVMAETVRLSPMKDGVSDPDRPQGNLNGVLRTAEQAAVRFASGRGEVARSVGVAVAAGGALLALDPVAYADIDLVQGDKVRATSRPGKPLFEVDHVDPDTHHRVMVYLKGAGR